MPPWAIALLVKPLAAVMLFVVVFGGAWLLAWGLHKVLPDSRVKRVLFDGWDQRRTARRARKREGVLDNAPLLRRDSREDVPRP